MGKNRNLKLGVQVRSSSERHIWTHAEIVALLGIIEQHVSQSHDSFEKPTSQQFYRMISAQNPLLKDINWLSQRTKMHNLKKIYNKAIKIKDQAAAEGIDEVVIAQKLNRICPYFHVLKNIFGEQRGCELIVEPNIYDFLFPNNDVSEMDRTTDDTASTPRIVAENILCSESNQKDSMASKNHMDALINIQEKKLLLDFKKLELKQLKEENKFKIKQMEMLHLMEIKKMELDKKLEERLLIEKLRLEANAKIDDFESENKSNKTI